MVAWIGPAIAAGASIAGSLLGKGSADDDRAAQERISRSSIELQRQFAQDGIQWRVADAKKAGIHPLYALGAQIPTFSPSTYIPAGDNGAGAQLAEAGQYLGRAIDATRTQADRTQARLEALTIERGELENDLLRSRIAVLEQQRNPPMPAVTGSQVIPGQSDVDRLGLTVTGADSHVQAKPQEVTPPNPKANYMEPSPIVDMGLAWTGTGYAPVPSKDMKDRSEDMMVPEAMWAVRNLFLPNVGAGKPPPAHLLPEGSNNWRWSYSRQEWQPYYDPHKARVPVRRGYHGPDHP